MAEENTQPTENQPQLPLENQQAAVQTGLETPLEPTTITIEAEGEAPPQQQEGGDQLSGQSDRQADDDVVVDASPTSPEGHKPKKHVPTRQRINQLTAQRKEAEERAAYWEAEAKKHFGAAQSLHQQRQQTERQSMQLWHDGLKAKQEGARRELAEAQSGGEPEAIAAAIEKLSALTADLRTAEVYLQRTPAQQPQQAQQQPQRQPPPQQSSFTPEVQAWMKENSWYTPGSPDFDPDMSEFALSEAKKLEVRLRRAGRTSEIGRAAYLAQIDKAVREEFPDMFDDEPAPTRQPLRMQASGPNGAVGSSGVAQNGVRQNGRQTIVQLSAEEREYARNMQKKHETGPKAGQPYTDAEKEQHFARLKADIARGKSPGGVEINMNIRGR